MFSGAAQRHSCMTRCTPSSSVSTACEWVSTTSHAISGRRRRFWLSRSIEAAEFIQRCFTEKVPFDHEGRYYTFKNVDSRCARFRTRSRSGGPASRRRVPTPRRATAGA